MKTLNTVTMSNIRDHLLPFKRSPPPPRSLIMVGPHCTTLGHSNNTICIIRDHCLASTPATSRNQNCFNVVPMYPTLAQQRPSPNILTVSVPSIMVPATIGVTPAPPPPPWKTLGWTNGCNAGPATAQYWLNVMCLLACPSLYLFYMYHFHNFWQSLKFRGGADSWESRGEGCSNRWKRPQRIQG